VSLQ